MTKHEMNPVRANMVEHPGEYLWSSFKVNALGEISKLITPHHCYLRLGQDKKEQCDNYLVLFNRHIVTSEITVIRDSTNKGWVLGSKRFLSEIEVMLNRRVAPAKRNEVVTGALKCLGKIKRSDPIDYSISLSF